MKSVTVLGIIVISLLLLAGAGCKSLALGGKEKYKVDMNNVFVAVRGEVDGKGVVSDETVERFTKLLDKHREEFGKVGSFTRAEQALEKIKEAKADQNTAYNLYQEALSFINESQEYLKTEMES